MEVNFQHHEASFKETVETMEAVNKLITENNNEFHKFKEDLTKILKNVSKN